MRNIMKRFLRRLPFAVVCFSLAQLASPSTTEAAEAIRVFSAGSLVAPLKEVIAASGVSVEPVFGPAGLLRQRLEDGEKADLFLSADLAQPQKLVEQNKSALVVPFARNKLCALSRTSLGVTNENLLGKMLDPNVRLATSTPGADPGGDYTWAMFAKAESAHPGAKSALEAKSLKLIGSPNAMVPIAGKTVVASIFLSDKADIVVYYCSGQAETLRDVEGLVSRPVPPSLEVPVVYGMTFTSKSPDAYGFALFLLSDRGQAILAKYQLIPML